MPAMQAGPLQGLRVVEMGQLIAGPFCGQLLGDMGADVVKIEPPGAGDPMRAWGRGEFQLWWDIIARNKRSASIDLRQDAGQDLVRRLISKADILIENFRPGTLERWNLDPDVLIQGNPRLIVVRVSGYGQEGPYSGRAGFGGIGEAMGGWRHIVGDPDRPPSRMGVSIGDSLAATFGCMGALAALHHRDQTGEGQIVDSSLYEAVLQMMEGLLPEYAIAGYVRERTGSVLPGIAPSNVYRCTDGDYLIGANQDSVFRRLCSALGQPELADDPQFATHLQRGRNQTELDGIVEAWTSIRSVAEVEAAMIEHAIPAGSIFTAREMLEDPHFAARESIVYVDHPKWGRFPMQNGFPRMSATPTGFRHLAPQEIGQHTREVLADIGVGDDELALLRDAGIVSGPRNLPLLAEAGLGRKA